MNNILANQTLEIEKLLSFRGKVSEIELIDISKEMDTYIKKEGSRRVGFPVNATFGVEDMNGVKILDVEILIPIDNNIKSNNKFIFKEKIKIVNAIMLYHRGNPMSLMETGNDLRDYIILNKLTQITAGYQVTISIGDTLNDIETQIYVGISQNII